MWCPPRCVAVRLRGQSVLCWCCGWDRIALGTHAWAQGQQTLESRFIDTTKLPVGVRVYKRVFISLWVPKIESLLLVGPKILVPTSLKAFWDSKCPFGDRVTVRFRVRVSHSFFMVRVRGWGSNMSIRCPHTIWIPDVCACSSSFFQSLSERVNFWGFPLFWLSEGVVFGSFLANYCK